MRDTDERVAVALPFFAGLEAESTKSLLAAASLERFVPRADVIRQGEPADFLHVVTEGRIEVFSAHGGRETTIDVLAPGDCFILAAVFLGQDHLKSARALTPARLLLIPAPTVRAVFRSDPAFAESCAAELARGYRRLVKEVSNLKLRSSQERLANFLLGHVPQDVAQWRFMLPFDKKTLAAKLGIAPEVLSRNFAALAVHGVRVSGRSVELADVAELSALARPSPHLDDPGY